MKIINTHIYSEMYLTLLQKIKNKKKKKEKKKKLSKSIVHVM